MNFSLTNGSEYKDEVYEIKVKANRLGDIFDFMKLHPEKRYNIQLNIKDIELKKFAEQMEYVTSVTDNYVVGCSSFESIKTLLDNKIDFPIYLDIPITTWEDFVGLRDKGVTDIIIDGQLLFSRGKILIGKRELNIRCRPTVSTSGYWTNNGFSSAFIRPEDLNLYEGCIDIIEFPYNTTSEDVLYKVYKRGNFVDNIEKLFPQLKSNIVNSLLPPDFGEHRADCEQKCKIPGRSCRYCENAVKTTEKLSKFFNDFNKTKEEYDKEKK